MKPTELMIRDWVFKDMNYSEEDPMYAKLDYRPYRIMSGEDIDLACETNCIGDADVYQPIPLTPEILEKNGFEYKKGWAEWWHRSEDGFGSDFQLSITEDGFSMKDIGNAKINFVHQLQHALRLCGLNNLADNLKLEE